MKKVITAIALACAMSSAANAKSADYLKLEKGTTIVKDFGERVDLDELLAAFDEKGIRFNRIRLQGQGSYQTSRAVYRGSRYKLTIDRRTGKITWVSRIGISVAILD